MKENVKARIKLEQDILGIIMLSGVNAYLTAVTLLSETSFLEPRHRKIWNAISRLAERNDDIEIISVTALVGEVDYLAGLQQGAITDAFLEQQVRLLKEAELRDKFNKLKTRATPEDADIFDEIEKLQTDLISLTSFAESKSYDAKHTAQKLVEHVEKFNSGTYNKIYTGLQSYDDKFGAFHPGDLITIAARPSIGKTALGLSMAYNQVYRFNKPKKVLYLSLEMPVEQLALRHYSMYYNESMDTLRRMDRYNEWQVATMTKFAETMKQKHIEFDLGSANEVLLYNKIKTMKRKNLVDIVYIDYLGLMHSAKKENLRTYEIGNITGKMKQAAKEFEIPIVMLVQLNRNVENTGKSAGLAELRDSGSIEQDSDIVMFIDRPEKYGRNKFQDGTDCIGLAQLRVEKFRNGATGIAVLKFDSQRAMFTDTEVTDYKPQQPKPQAEIYSEW